MTFSEYTMQVKNGDTLRMRVNRIMDTLDAMAREAHDVFLTIADLEERGISTARPYWMRKDDPDGKPDQLELTHPTNSEYYNRTGRRREYIGTDPDKIAAALDAIERLQKHQRLTVVYNDLAQKIRTAENHIVAMEGVVMGKQQKLWDKTSHLVGQ